MRKKVLVLGGAGFIGSYVNKLLDESGYQTIVLDNLSRGHQKMATRGLFVKGDLGNKDDLKEIFNQHQIDAVMHFAAHIDVGESVLNPAAYYENNVVNTLRMIETLVEFKINCLIFSSSAAVYGIPQADIIKEDHPCLPINPYGKTKLMVENILEDFDRAYGLKYSCLRYFNAAGGDPQGEIKNFKTKEGNLIPLIVRNVKSGTPLTIYGTDYDTPDGTCIRDYIHIHDLATAHINAMEQLWKRRQSSIYNLGSQKGYSVKEVINATEKVVGKKVNVVEGKRREGDPAVLIANADKAKRDLGWQTQFSLDAMIEHAWKSIEL